MTFEPHAAKVSFRRVTLEAFRNIESLTFEPAPRLNVITGDNGHGKTSVLEALYFVATTKSFRTERVATLVRDGSPAAWVKAQIEEGAYAREQRAGVVGGARRVTLDGKRPERFVDYAQRTPIVAFHPGDLELVSGSSSSRRRLLDRVALFVDPAGFEHRSRYDRALKERQRVLVERGERAAELDAFEPLVAEHGARYQAARERAAHALLAALEPAFERLRPERLELAASYLPGGSLDAAVFLAEVRARRFKDRVRRAATYGPGRDEIELSLAGRSARAHASQGQQRLLTLALKLAELECIRRARGAFPVLLLDDVSSELDPERTFAVYELLRASTSQVFVTTPRPELFPTPDDHASERVDWSITDGVLTAR